MELPRRQSTSTATKNVDRRSSLVSPGEAPHLAPPAGSGASERGAQASALRASTKPNESRMSKHYPTKPADAPRSSRSAGPESDRPKSPRKTPPTTPPGEHASLVSRLKEAVRRSSAVEVTLPSPEELDDALNQTEGTPTTPPAEPEVMEDEEGDGGEDEEETEDLKASSVEQLAAEVTFTKKVTTDEPVRKAPPVEARSLVGPYIWLSVTPFPHRMHAVAFMPADRPWEGDSQANANGVYVTPHSLDPAPCFTGKRKRIGRKNKFGALLWSIPEGAVRFSSVTSIFGTAGFEEAEEEDERAWSVRWCKRVEPDEYKALLPNQKINHFPGTWGIGRKDNLHKHLTQYANKYGRDVYNFHPEAWLLPQDGLALQNDMNAKLHCPPNMTDNVYIIKQVASACGRRMRLLCKGSVPKGKWIVQRYVHDPLLIYGYKFDLRIYVVVTSYYPLRLYVYEEGLVRFATSPYPVPKNGRGMKVKSATAHLTNYSVNKHNTEAFVNPADGVDGEDEEKGSKWVLSTVKRYFEKNGLDWVSTWAKIEDVIIKTILAVEPNVVNQMRTYFGVKANGQVNNCFEVYGFDVLLRQDLSPILMEVNIMPSLATRCSLLDQRVKANMIADMLTLVGAYSMEKSHKPRPKDDTKSLGHPFLDSLSINEAEIVCQAEEENLRRMHYKRLFPTHTAFERYRHLFLGGRQLNGLLMEWERAKLSNPPPWLTNTPTTPVQNSIDDDD